MRSTIFVLAILALSSCPSPDPCQSLCGCWEDTTLSVSGNTRAADGTSVSGINVSCKGESGPMDVTDTSGAFDFEYWTRTSPGCGYEGCNTLLFVDPAQQFRSKELTVWEVRNADGGVVLQP